MVTRSLDRPRVVGPPARWARNGGALGLLLGALAPTAFTTGFLLRLSAILPFDAEALWALAGMHGLCGLVAGGFGALGGLAAPALLDRVRGRWPLAAIGLAATAAGQVGGALAGAAWIAPLARVAEVSAESVAFVVACGSAVGAVAATLWWLPFTVATVLGARGWPITWGVGVGVPAAIALVLACM